ncbi:hypothetical protein [Ferroplasma sp.]|nr:hypothetical protein [Ferroplasma sp.]
MATPSTSFPQIRVSKETYFELKRLKFELEVEKQEDISYDDVIKFLLSKK